MARDIASDLVLGNGFLPPLILQFGANYPHPEGFGLKPVGHPNLSLPVLPFEVIFVPYPLITGDSV
jgi:hypothetical protein